MHYQLIQFTKDMGVDVTIRLFCENHGKTQIDGVAFGQPGIAGIVKEMIKNERFRTTEQLVDYGQTLKGNTMQNGVGSTRSYTHGSSVSSSRRMGSRKRSGRSNKLTLPSIFVGKRVFDPLLVNRL